MRNRKGYFALLGLIVSLAVALIIVFILFNINSSHPIINKDTKKTFLEQGIDTSNYQAIKESTKNKMEEINRQYEKQLNSISSEADQ